MNMKHLAAAILLVLVLPCSAQAEKAEVFIDLATKAVVMNRQAQRFFDTGNLYFPNQILRPGTTIKKQASFHTMFYILGNDMRYAALNISEFVSLSSVYSEELSPEQAQTIYKLIQMKLELVKALKGRFELFESDVKILHEEDGQVFRDGVELIEQVIALMDQCIH